MKAILKYFFPKPEPTKPLPPPEPSGIKAKYEALKAEHEALKTEHEKVVAGQVKLLAWVKTTHRLHRAPEGIRALIQEGRRIVPALAMLFMCNCLFAQAPPILRNSWTTNTAGNPVVGNNNLSVTNASAAGTNWAFFGIGPSTIARLTDVTNIASAVSGASGLTTNDNQFLGAPLSIKDAARMTNISLYNTTTVASADSPIRFATPTNVFWMIRPGNNLNNGVTNYTLEMGWNADGAITGEPSFEMEFEASFRDPAGLDFNEWYIQRGDPDGHFYRPLYIQQRRNGHSNAVIQVRGDFDVIKNGDLTNNSVLSPVVLSVNTSNQVITTSSNVLVRGFMQILGSSAAQPSILIQPAGMANGVTIDMDNGDNNLYFYNRENGNIFFAANAQIGMTLTPAQRLGVGGVLAPLATLHVTNVAGAAEVLRVGATARARALSVSSNGAASVSAGNSESNAVISGAMFATTTSFTNLNATGTMTNLANVTIPAHFMTNSLDAVHAIWRGTMPLAVPNTNQFQIVFGSTTILDTGLQTASNTVFEAECWIVRTGNTSQHVEGRFEWGPGNGAPFAFTNANLEIAETNGINTVLALKGGARRLGAHTNNFFRVWYEPATR